MENIKDVLEKLAQYEKREKELELSEARLKMAIEATGLGTWDYNPITGDLYWSDECKKIFGLPLNQSITFQQFVDHVHPVDKDNVQKDTEHIMDRASDGRYDITYRILRFDDKSIRWVRVKGKVYFNTEQKADRFIGTIIDITDSKQANEKIARSEKLFRSIALSIPKSLIIVIDKDHRYMMVEGDMMQRLGYDRRNYEGKHPLEIAPPERYEASKHLYEKVLAGETFSIERKAETGEDYMVHFVPLKNDNEEVEAGLILALDITDIKQAEEKSAKLAAIIESSDDAIISKTLDSIITSWNDSAERMFGYTADEMIGQSILKIIPPDRKDEEPQILSRLRKGERVEHFETKRITKDNTLLDISLSISPVKDPRGNIIGLSKIARDITEKKQEEQRKNDFIAMVSHELKTPLTSVKSYVQVLLERAKKDNDRFMITALSRADVQTRKMTTMIHDFLSLARLQDGKISLRKEPFDLKQLIEEVAGDTQFLTSNHSVELKDCRQITINADRDKIAQVIMNLLSNAIKYSPDGGTITMGCEKKDGTVKVYVQDEGIGISLTDQKRLFERFYRVQNLKIKTVSGFGIGLYLVSEILRYHDSNIEVESKEGVGSTFYFLLPVFEMSVETTKMKSFDKEEKVR
jgi:PAS domain S-box-containing protein